MIHVLIANFIACIFCFISGSNERVDLKMIDKHINSFAVKKKEDGFYLFGSGGQMMDNIKKVHLSFDLQKKVEIDEARVMLIDMTQDFIKQVNADEKIRPYLNNYPFDHMNAEFNINFKDKRHIYLEEGIASAMMVGNKIYYSKSNSETSPLVTVFEETYAEALEKVKQQKAQLTITSGS